MFTLINTVNNLKLSKDNNGFSVHASNCQDLTKALAVRGVHADMEAATLDELAAAFEADMVAGGFEPGEWDFNRDVKLFPCCHAKSPKPVKAPKPVPSCRECQKPLKPGAARRAAAANGLCGACKK